MPSPKPVSALTPGRSPLPEPGIALVGFAETTEDSIRQALGSQSLDIRSLGATDVPADPGEAFLAGHLSSPAVEVLCLGPELAPAVGRKLLEHFLELENGRDARILVLGAQEESRRYFDLLAMDRLFFLSPGLPDPDEVAWLIRGALEHLAAFREVSRPRSLEQLFSSAAPSSGGDREGVAESSELLLGEVMGHTSAASLIARTATTLERLLGADRVDCFLYQPESETLRSVRDRDGEAETAAMGTIAFVLRTARPARFDRISASPFFDPELDSYRSRHSAARDEDARFLAVPITVEGRSGPVALATWVAWRNERSEPFTEADRTRIAREVQPLVPILTEWLRREARQRLERQEAVGRQGEEGRLAFRQEAVEHYYEGLADRGEVLRISPEWTRLAYPLLLLLFLSALLFTVLGHVHEYAEGVGVIRLEGRVDVTAPVGGTVSEVLVGTGEAVEPGRLLVKLYDVQEEAELERIEREFELGLLERLRRPSDPATARTLGALRAQRQLAEARLEERSVRAPAAGTISDLRIREGQLLSPGEVILSLQRQEEERKLLGVVPGQYRPQIHPGMPLRFEMEGFRYAYQHLEVAAVSDEIFGPTEARRFLGPGIGDAVPLSGPVVLIEAPLPADSFESEGRSYAYHDGGIGRIELRLRSERILLTLVPGLKALWTDDTAGASQAEDGGG